MKVSARDNELVVQFDDQKVCHNLIETIRSWADSYRLVGRTPPIDQGLFPPVAKRIYPRCFSAIRSLEYNEVNEPFKLKFNGATYSVMLDPKDNTHSSISICGDANAKTMSVPAFTNELLKGAGIEVPHCFVANSHSLLNCASQGVLQRDGNPLQDVYGRGWEKSLGWTKRLDKDGAAHVTESAMVVGS